MSAIELIKEFEALPKREQNKFLRAIQLRNATSHRQIDWPDVEARAAKITGNRIIPNAVLFEREESQW